MFKQIKTLILKEKSINISEINMGIASEKTILITIIAKVILIVITLKIYN